MSFCSACFSNTVVRRLTADQVTTSRTTVELPSDNLISCDPSLVAILETSAANSQQEKEKNMHDVPSFSDSKMWVCVLYVYTYVSLKKLFQCDFCLFVLFLWL